MPPVEDGNPSLSAVILGEESLLIQCGEIFRERGHSLLAVVSDTPQIVSWAQQAGLRVEPPGKDLATRLAGLAPDFVLSITNLSILPDDVVALAKRRAINFHDGPLPSYAGMYTPVWALLAGESRYGITFHEIKGGIDEGDILLQKHFDVEPGETSLSLNTKNYGAAIEAFGELLTGLEQDNLAPVTQDLSTRHYYARHDRPEAACVIDLSAEASTTERLIRALDFGRYENPVGLPKLMHQGQAIGVGSVQREEGWDGVAAGTLLEVVDDGLRVSAKDAVLHLSGLSRLEGEALSGPQAAALLGVRGGESLQGPTPQERTQLTERNQEACRSEARWVQQLSTLDGVEVPYLRPERTGQGSPSRGSLTIEVPQAFSAAFAQDGDLGDAVLCAAALYLARLGGRERLDVGLLDSEVNAQAAVCPTLFSRLLPFRAALPGSDLSVRDGIARLRKTLERCRKRGPVLREVAQRYPQLTASAELQAGNLLPVLLAQPKAEQARQSLDGALLAFVVAADGRGLTLDYDERALSPAHATAMAHQLQTVLSACAQDPDQRLRSVSLMTPQERDCVLVEWNATETPLPGDETIVSLFEAQATKTPQATALSCEGRSLTYAELDARANKLAHHLRELGVGPDVMAGIYVERSLDLLISMLGIMKAGGAYLPLDPAYPRDRIAFMLQDSGVPVVLTQAGLRAKLPPSDARVVAVDADWPRIDQHPAEPPARAAAPTNLAYVIYTSGSTGKPKGVQVEHRNAVNFFVGMDGRIPHDPPGVWLAVTSLSFDISVLELLWTLCRGFHVVLNVDRTAGGEQTSSARPSGPFKHIDFGVFLWGNDDAAGSGKYELMVESAKFADRHGFTFVSTPERHFHSFGGPFPNPSVTGAALAMITDKVQIRSGSCVLPLHHPIRVAEEWAVVDNLSDGRVALSIAAGWQPNDFVIRPAAFKGAKQRMFEDIEVLRKLWRGEAVEFENPMGDLVKTSTLPRPVQPEVPIWVTTAGNVETYEMAGRAGAHVLTHLLGQTVEQVAEKVEAYRKARAEAGLDPKTGKVTLMLHTFVGDSTDEVREIVRQPMKDYLGSSVALIKGFAWSFPAFRRPEGVSETDDVGLDHLTEEEMDALLDHAFERYFETSGLFGTPERCAQMVERVRGAGIDEIACLIDYGIPTATVLQSLPALAQAYDLANTAPAEIPEGDFSIPALCQTHGVTHFQCTPSMAKMMTVHGEMRAALSSIQHVMIGGEALPLELAREVSSLLQPQAGRVTNMYGPTETTIWSTTQPIEPGLAAVHIGRPIANTQLYIVDPYGEATPQGVAGELLIGGDGVVRGYHARPELTAERFIADRFRGQEGQRVYRTGDRARYLDDGTVEFLGRLDFQVKIRGYRIELGEVETALSRQPGVRECVVVAQPDPSGDPRLVAYLVPDGAAPAESELREGLRQQLPEFMLPSVFAVLQALPLTPNGKVDRKALPSPEQLTTQRKSSSALPENETEQRIAGVWESVLQLSNIGRDDNFFDLGGHSLLVVQVHRVLREQLEVPLSLTDLYRFPTVASLASRLSGDSGDEGVEEARGRGADRRKALAARRRRRART